MTGQNGYEEIKCICVLSIHGRGATSAPLSVLLSAVSVYVSTHPHTHTHTHTHTPTHTPTTTVMKRVPGMCLSTATCKCNQCSRSVVKRFWLRNVSSSSCDFVCVCICVCACVC